MKAGQFVSVKRGFGHYPKSGTWLLVQAGANPKVHAPCYCCGFWCDWNCHPDQIKPAKAIDKIYGGRRSDGYHFFLIKKGKSVRVRAGCRNFTVDQARLHWKQKGGAHGKWSLRTLAKMVRDGKRRGWI